ncbi:MAG: CGNR zinc finger domain-containing protein [Rhizobiaceae bacterium]
MTVEWTEHRFAGGVLALDVANTVVLRGDVARTFDRFDNVGELPRFAAAASRFRGTELKGKFLTVADAAAEKPRLVTLREAIDRLFRRSVGAGDVPLAELPNLLSACAHSLRCSQEAQASGRQKLEEAVALSALSLLSEVDRIRICQNCRWLFLDRSKNGSRRWCDMAVCGNRQKAKRHYHRRRVAVEDMA